MELVLIGLVAVIALCIIIGTVSFITAILTLLYGKLYYDNSEYTGKRKWTMFRYAWFWKALRAYVSFEIRDAESNKRINRSLSKHIKRELGENVIFACHPHGLIPLAPLLTFGALSETYFPAGLLHPRLHVHRLLFAIPLVRDICLWLGFMDISEKVLISRLIEDLGTEPIALIPAGSRGILGETDSETKHRGFLRLAYKYKALIIPCWSPAETSIFKTWDLFPSARRWAVSSTGYPFPTPFIGPLPFKKLTMYIGRAVCPQEYDTLEAFQNAYHSQLKQLMSRYDKDGIVC